MTGEINIPRPRQSQEEVVAYNIDLNAINESRFGKEPLGAQFEDQFGEREVNWRIERLPEEHTFAGQFARAVGMIPVKVVATESGLEYAREHNR